MYFKNLYDEYKNELKAIGSTMQKFYNNLNSFNESLINHNQFGLRFLYLNENYTGYTPLFKCEIENLKDDLNKKTSSADYDSNNIF